jgi:pimeloyl-ACP methyl ester carboxylesterase
MTKNEPIIYLFSGLGADKSVFDNLTFLKTQKHKFIEWEKPKSNNLEDYALQLSSQIDTTKKVILIGISFGGMLVSELSKHIQTEKVILISSAENPAELPFLYRLLEKLKFYFFIPTFLLDKPNKLLSFAFGTAQNKYKKEEKQLYQIIKNSNPKFAKSFIKMILTWKSKNDRSTTNSIFKIHGTNDLIVPHSKNKMTNQFLIKNGGHFMILTHSEEVNTCIEGILESL